MDLQEKFIVGVLLAICAAVALYGLFRVLCWAMTDDAAELEAARRQLHREKIADQMVEELRRSRMTSKRGQA